MQIHLVPRTCLRARIAEEPESIGMASSTPWEARACPHRPSSLIAQKGATMELWAWMWTAFDPRTGDGGKVMGATRPCFSGAEARDKLVERIRFRAATDPGYAQLADLVEAAEPPLTATLRNEVFCVAKVDEDGRPLQYGDFARKQDFALTHALKDKRRPKVW
ncbi:hypothetical protein ACFQVC_23955 [Streptomyces monticola]|uniref:Uncharacterized protein n=1 Tax=Streptomyces monticola TaxID=2666263 RepID=A0ABW2JNV6_9ACTN